MTPRASRRAFVIGWPISHSRSPLMHGHWLKTYGIAGSYEPVAVPAEYLPAFFDQIRAGEWRGGNVTLPHKEAALTLADERDAAADAVGAANTIVTAGGRLFASNTDVAGFLDNLDAQSPNWREVDGPAIVLGAGGAARAVVWALLQAGVERIQVVNRTPERAGALADRYGDRVHAFAWSQASSALAEAALLVNTTVLGMAGMPPLELDLDTLPPSATVADIVYAPLETDLLKQAKTRGNPVVEGLGMLLYQAVPGFEAWFGVRPEVTAKLRELIVADLNSADG